MPDRPPPSPAPDREARLALLIERMPMSMHVLDADGRTVGVNPAFERLWGITAADLADYSIWSDPQHEANGVRALMRRVYAGETVEFPPFRHDAGASVGLQTGARERVIAMLGYPVADDAGRLREVVLLHTDVTERVAGEAAVAAALADERAARAEAEALGDVLRDLLAHTELDAVLARVTHHARALLGAGYAAVSTVEPGEGTRWLAIDGNDTDAWRTATFAPGTGTAGRVIAAGAPLVIHGFPDNPAFPPHEFPVHAAERMRSALGVPLADAAGRPFGALIVGWREPAEIGDREVALATALARPASIAIANARLVRALGEARAEAERANRVKSEFLAVMSHELRTPLNAIGGYAELIELGIRGPVTAEQRQDLARIRASQRHLLRLINNVLDFAKLEAGHVTYELGPVAVADAVADVLPLVAPQAQAKRIALEFAPPAGAVAAVADRDKLGQVLLNLLSNAVKFTPPDGRVSVEVRAEGPAAPAGGAGAVRVRVCDTGPGIAPAAQAAVFDPFVQVPGAGAERRQEGTGLGLAISRDLARGMGGDLTVESAPGAGSTFTLALPRA